MDIHPPAGPTNTLREFFTHIAIVTVGILIALSLEGIEETVHEHRLVRETRENIRIEFHENRRNIGLELENTQYMRTQLNLITNNLPAMRQHPEQMAPIVAKLLPSDYYVSSSSWDAALSTGALAHMSATEVSQDAGLNLLVHSYAGLEQEADPFYNSMYAFFLAHPNIKPADKSEIDTGIERILLFSHQVDTMIHVGKELQSSTQAVLDAR